MMIPILCRSAVLYLTLFPGVLFFIVKKTGLGWYSSILFFVVLLNTILWEEYGLLTKILLIILVPTMIYIVEKSIKNRIFQKLEQRMINAIMIIVVVPVLEELIFKLFIYRHLNYFLNYDQWIKTIVFIFVSSTVFVVAHISTQKIEAIYKIIFGIVTAVIFVITENIFLCIGIHVAFNAIVYVARIPKMVRRGMY